MKTQKICSPKLLIISPFFKISVPKKWIQRNLCIMTLTTGLMLHPIVSLPLSNFMKLIINGIERLLGLCRIDARHKLKFTLSMYFAMIILIQIFLTQCWELKFQDVSAGHENDRQAISFQTLQMCLDGSIQVSNQQMAP